MHTTLHACSLIAPFATLLHWSIRHSLIFLNKKMGDKVGVINDKSLPCSIHKCFGSALQFFAGARTAFEFGRSEIVAMVGTQLSNGVCVVYDLVCVYLCVCLVCGCCVHSPPPSPSLSPCFFSLPPTMCDIV